MVVSLPALTVGMAITVMLIASGAETQPIPEDTTNEYVYTSAAARLNTGLLLLVLLNPIAGLHAKVLPPLPLRVVIAPLQIITSAPALAFRLSTVMLIVLGAETQLGPEAVMSVYKYVPGAVPLNTVTLLLVVLNAVAGDHIKVAPPVPVRVVLVPQVMVTLEPGLAINSVTTVTTAFAALLQRVEGSCRDTLHV